MADHIPSKLKHLRFKAHPESLNYQGHGRGNTPPLFQRTDRAAHVNTLRRQLDEVSKEFESINQLRAENHLSSEFGLIIDVSSEPGFPLKHESLEKTATKNKPAVTLLNLRHEETEQGTITHAAIFVPFGQLTALENKVSAYADPAKDGKHNPSNAALLNNIHRIRVAAMEALWTDPDPLPDQDTIVWFELWIRRGDQKNWHQNLLEECERLQILVTEQTLTFPDHTVVLAHASRHQLESSLDLLNCLSEVRLARPCSIGLTDLSGIEQEEWIDEALTRINWPTQDAPAVCLLDTGVNRSHPLLEPMLEAQDMASVFEDKDTSDDPVLKHGTPMAGLAGFGDIRNLMLSPDDWDQLHRLESVKLIRSSSQHKPENYGAVTLQAISEPEITQPDRPRVFCMAVTTPGPNTHGRPSAWSTALDIAASGTQSEDDSVRVILVSTGNTHPEKDHFSYPQSNHENPVEDPAQAWNVISVGAITSRSTITEEGDEARLSSAIAPSNELSPFTRTSHSWHQEDRADWPLAPDIVMEGGNIGRSQDGDLTYFDSLQPLSTASQFSLRPLSPFNATSAATALASRVAAQIQQKYPKLQPETLRGLLIHSARWPQEALAKTGVDPFASGSTQAMQQLMRSYGHGVVDEQRALNSLNNQTTFYVENTIQPYTGDAGGANFNECHLIELPWPKDLLFKHPDTTFTLRVTLSYFIQPNPGSRTWEKSQKYKYASHLLGFRDKHPDESLEEFRSRLNADEETQGDSLSDSRWALGRQIRGKSGSLVQDVWRGSAADLASMEAIAVYPRAKGWWATRKYGEDRLEHNCHLKSVPYSLIISIETEEDLPLYTEVSKAITQIATQASSSIS